jgi:hypothetical protein
VLLGKYRQNVIVHYDRMMRSLAIHTKIGDS